MTLNSFDGQFTRLYISLLTWWWVRVVVYNNVGNLRTCDASATVEYEDF